MADAGRVIAGSARGIRIAGPGAGTRPLGDRPKQTLFAILDPVIDGARVLDLFAGSGAAGLEALSRGAAAVVFVEQARAACGVIEENLRRTHLDDGRGVVRCADVTAFLDDPGRLGSLGPFDIAIVDPPYAEDDLRAAALARLGSADGGWLVDGGWVVVTHGRRHEPPELVGLLASERRKRFGENMLTFYRRRAGQGGG